VDGGGTDAGLSTDHKPDYPSEKERIYRSVARARQSERERERERESP